VRHTESRPLRATSKLAIVLGLLASALGTAVTTATPVLATSVSVWVSYADSLRADPVNFPTPWSGSPNTIFEGCTPAPACVYDAGAIRIVNNSTSPVTVNAVAVHIDTCSFTGWPSAVLAPGAELIVTQLTSGAVGGCTGPVPAQFDSSDIGPKSSNYVNICTPDGIVPVVDVTINGTTTSYHDTGQVLNTGGIDAGPCSGNESSQWTVIGTGPCRGSLLTLAPATQTDPVLSTATVTATFTNSCGQPLSNAAVDFKVIAGVNPGVTGAGVTDANGRASFSYSSAKVGTDTLQATVTNLAGSIPSNTVTVKWTVSFAPGGGAFVISDLKDVQGGGVYWWGAQWWKQDHLRGGLAPASFKGFENSIASPWCGQTWTTRPGNSSRPPKAVAPNSLMAVIVSSWVTKRGSVISGNVLHIVLVRVNPGYGPNPGHPGTGTVVVATLC
jgi:Bacterial Ig-like domain (group 1)